MWLVPKPESAGMLVDVFAALTTALDRSRFRANVSRQRRGRAWGLKLEMIRLRRSKEYCGHHPGPCVVNPYVGAKAHRRSCCLEGSDWCGFNDGLNDLLDAFSVSADVWSYNGEAARYNKKGMLVGAGRFFVRKGLCRRTRYEQLSHYDDGILRARFWSNDGANYTNCCGQLAERSYFPAGTPGFACWTLAEEEEALCLSANDH